VKVRQLLERAIFLGGYGKRKNSHRRQQ